jgi:putative protein-disulfide isomerase
LSAAPLKLLYIHDPLCGWCYAAAPLVHAAAREGIDITLLGGALWPQPTTLPREMRLRIREADKRISAMTGQVFGEAYHEHLLPGDSLVLESRPPLAALLAVRALDPSLELAMLQAIQRAHYVEARRVVDPAVLTSLAEGLGLDREAFARAMQEAPVEQHVAEARALMRRTGVAGFPAAFLVDPDDPGALMAAPPQDFLGRPADYVSFLRQHGTVGRAAHRSSTTK